MNADLQIDNIFHMLSLLFADALSKFEYASDEATWGKEEWWATYAQETEKIAQCGKIVGDCDDFAGYCVHQCRAAGIPARFVLCYDELDECHCVCIADEKWLLDNRQTEVILWAEAEGYKWVSASGLAPGQPWHVIVPGVFNA